MSGSYKNIACGGEGDGAGASCGGFGTCELTRAHDDDRDDDTVDTDDTGHNDGDDGAHYELWLEHTHTADTDATLGRAVSGAKVC